MKKAMLLIGIALILAMAVPAFSSEFPDVPADHWAYAAVQQLADAGIIQGYPDGTYGGKRAMTRYEFAEAIAKAIPVIVEAAQTGIMPTNSGVTTPPVMPAHKCEVSKEQFDALQKLVNEFGNELAAIGVDVEALRRDIAALNERVTAIEEEMDRIKFFGDITVVGIGGVENEGNVRDRDDWSVGDSQNPLENANFLTDLQFGIRAKVGDNVTVNGLFATTNYLGWALDDSDVDDFVVWNAYMQADCTLGIASDGQIMAGRISQQMTPLTMMFTDPDSYTDDPKLDNGDYVIDGVSGVLEFGTVGLTAFAGQTYHTISCLSTPSIMLGDDYVHAEQIAGGRLLIDMALWNGDLNLNYLQCGVDEGRDTIYGGDLSAQLGSFALSGEWAKCQPSDAMLSYYSGYGVDGTELDTYNEAYMGKLTVETGNLMVGGGYSNVEANYGAPGSWNRYGRAVNLRNVKGPMACASYQISPSLSIEGEAQWLTPAVDDLAITGRTASDLDGNEVYVNYYDIDKINYYRGGLVYGIDSNDSLKLGWEEVQWVAPVGDTTNANERYITLGVEHEFNPNSSMRFLYQLIEYSDGTPSPYYGSGDYRGGIASAQWIARY